MAIVLAATVYFSIVCASTAGNSFTLPSRLLCYATIAILLTKITAAKNEVTLSYDRVRGLCFLAVVFMAAIIQLELLMIVSSNSFCLTD